MTNRDFEETERPDPDHLDEADIPLPDHHVGVPAAPATSPPEPPIVPSDAEVTSFWADNRATLLLIGAGVVIALLVISQI